MTQQLEHVQEQPRNRDGELRDMTQQLINVSRQLQERDGQLSEKDRQVRERDEQLREKTQQLTNTQGQLKEKDKQLREKTQQLTNVEGQLRERDGQLSGKDRQLKERDEQLREKTQQLTNTQGKLQERDGQLSEKDRQLRERDEQLREKTQELTNTQGQLREKDKQLRKKTQQLTNVEGQLQERDGQLRQIRNQLTDVRRHLQERDGQVSDITNQLTSVRGQLQEKNEEFTSLERLLRAKQLEIDELETSLSAAQRALKELSRRQTPDWVIPRDQIQLTDKCLGKGGWGSVIEGKYCGCAVAVKQMYELILSDHNRRLFEREMSIVARCHHPCLLQFIGATNDEGSPLFVTELMESSLRALLEQQPLSSLEVSVISLDVARALNYLHLQKPSPIIHRDISSANVLLWRQADQWRGKVSDYGMADVLLKTMTVGPGAKIYRAPEALTKHQTVKVCLKIVYWSYISQLLDCDRYKVYSR